jgi:predicted GNAT superfamily acetyltransferase
MEVMFRDGRADDEADILSINRLSLPGVSLLDAHEFATLCAASSFFLVLEIDHQVAGYLFALDGNATYDGEEFNWFCENIDGDFVYIDQVAIAPGHRKSGLAELLYDHLETSSLKKEASALVCEVNLVPENIPSRKFHFKTGFTEIFCMKTRGVVVSLFRKHLI